MRKQGSTTAMVIGILRFEMAVDDALSLKDKRRVVRSIKDRLHREHMVSVAEVGSLDSLRTACLGLVCAGSDARAVGRTLDLIVAKLDGWRDARLMDVRRDMLRADDIASEREFDEDSLARELLAHAMKADGPA